MSEGSPLKSKTYSMERFEHSSCYFASICHDQTFCRVSDSGEMSNIYSILTNVFAADAFRKFISPGTTTNLFSFGCCYGNISFPIVTITARVIFGVVPSLSH